jgi:hypothetical protein
LGLDRGVERSEMIEGLDVLADVGEVEPADEAGDGNLGVLGEEVEVEIELEIGFQEPFVVGGERRCGHMRGRDRRGVVVRGGDGRNRRH